jgi:hypothetical protein
VERKFRLDLVELRVQYSILLRDWPVLRCSQHGGSALKRRGGTDEIGLAAHVRSRHFHWSMQYLTTFCQAWLSFLSLVTQVQSARSLTDHVGGDSSFCILFESAAALQGKPLFILHPDKSRRSLQFTLLEPYPSRSRLNMKSQC